MKTRQTHESDGGVGGDRVCPEPLLVTAKQAAAMCGRSIRCWWTWNSAGLIPGPVKIGRATLWRVDELRQWTEAGCPRREEWEAQR